MNVRKKIVEKISSEAERKRLNTKLANLQARKVQLMKKLGQTRQRESANTRKSDRKFRENNARAVCARTKRADKAMLGTVDAMIRMIEKKLRKLA